MKYYKDFAGKVFAYESDGSQDEFIAEGLTLITDEEADALREAPQLSEEEIVKRQIAEIESTITVRRVREAVLGKDNGWLAERDAEIAALRLQL